MAGFFVACKKTVDKFSCQCYIMLDKKSCQNMSIRVEKTKKRG